ncbi:PSD1 and planctomycete cytochrome C domain-containing protein [Planctomicrobium sp. SH661]|uniref:PSD1 and planctomycete cytochrome C domain-containing protein n=1 Tax=Planctomicrobium sp. SH661 TaxID=3448124 RepID=UPI003F5C0FB1
MNVNRIRPLLRMFLVWGVGAFPSAGADLSAGDRIEYNRDIRPILSENCFACHGPDGSHREADLRLDIAQAASVAASSGEFAIVTGKSEESELIARITSNDPNLKMPPPESNKSISPDQIDKLKRWINEGAEYQGHWSFLPIHKPSVPDVEDSGLGLRNPIDAFVLAELQTHGLQLSPQADSVTLARRLSFDLIGLPPTPEQVLKLAADGSDAAYENLVDELLESPHFGERMAMWWLDLVRYADSVGYHGDQAVDVFPFREWVIESFNTNQRFDEFTREQLAGDLLPQPTLSQRIAAGYNRLGMMTQEGGAQPKEYLAKYAAERVRNIGGAWLGLTTGCCECHDHKFDPITTRDFYRLEAFFADIQEQGLYTGRKFGPTTVITTPEQDVQLARFDDEIAKLKQKLETSTPQLIDAQSQWEQDLARVIEWKVLEPTSLRSVNETVLTVQEGSSILASGANPASEEYTLAFAEPVENITALRIEVLPHDSLPSKGPGRAGNGNFVLSEVVASIQAADGSEQPVLLANPSASFEQVLTGQGNPYAKWAIAAVIDGDGQGANLGWAILPEIGKPQSAVLETQPDLKIAEGNKLSLKLSHHSQHGQHSLGHFRISVTSAARPVTPWSLDKLPDNIRKIIGIDSALRDDHQKEELAGYYRSISPLTEPVRSQLASIQTQRVAFYESLPTMLATVSVEPRVIRVLPRGNWMDDSGEDVQPGTPEFLPQLPVSEKRFTRQDLAEWLVSKENPLTARTLVNRLWKLFFGAGISRKLDDLGAQGAWPTHPQLLDWLAAELIDSGWDVKHAIRQIVMSKTYRQASNVSSELQEKDPFNHFLARQGRFRLDAEMVRDNALWISGLLVETVGGPSAKPYQPPRYWAYLNFPEREWQNDKGANLYRRGLYTHWQRQYLHPSLLAFDAPSREECTADRPRSNTPLQSLVLLNDPTYVEAARAFAELIMRQKGISSDERLDFAFQRALSRTPKPEEAALLLEMFEKHLNQFKADSHAAHDLLTVGDRLPAGDLDPAELAAWTSVTRTILNLHATITRN